jgi:hypothetical protein
VRAAYREAAERRVDERARSLLHMNVEHVDLYTDRPYAQALAAFFRDRDRRPSVHA